MSQRNRLAVAAFVVVGLLSGGGLLLFAMNACPGELPGQACPAAATNRIVVIGLAATTVALLCAPFAFLAEFILRRRIVYRGAWQRAMRRGVIAGLVVAVLAGLRVGAALTVAAALFIVLLAGAAEWFAMRRFDRP